MRKGKKPMIHFIYGRAGSGKTTEICKKAGESVAAGRKVFLIVPEQTALDAEKRMTDLLSGSSSLSLEILNFKRLCNYIFREVGGLSYSYITGSGRTLLMWKTLSELSPLLNTVKAPDRHLVSQMLSAATELKTYRISPHMLESAAKKLSKNEKTAKLSDKLYDISLIYATYINLSKELGDDAEDDLGKAAEALENNNIFSGADVFFDSFWGFTPQQFAIIEGIFSQADNVTVSLCLDADSNGRSDEAFLNQKKTAEKLLTLAEKCVSAHNTEDVRRTFLKENHRAKTEELRFLEKNLWSLDLSKGDCFLEESPSVKLYQCQSLFSECEAVAADICRKVREGASWRDFSVITRGIDRYEGVLDVILEKYGIPHFMSKRTDIKTKPIIKLILSAISLYTKNFECEDMISYIKTGLCQLSPQEVSAFENYLHLWNVRGKARFSEDFTMNPKGYTGGFTEESVSELDKINDIRERVVTPLEDLHAKFREAKTVTDFSAALYEFLTNIKIPEILQKITDSIKLTVPDVAQETEQLWSVMVDTLDELTTVLGDTEVDAAVYSELLKILFDETDIGKIPETLDSAVCGDASLLRADSKHMYIIGANDGIFPAAQKNSGVFSDTDCEILAAMGVELAPGGEYAAADERFLFYRAAASASHSLTVTFASAELSGQSMKPSFAVTRLKSLFPSSEVINYTALPLEKRLEGRGNILEFIAESEGTALGKALKSYAEGDEALAQRLCKLKLPLCDDEEMLDRETTEKLFGGDLALTQSRLESYVLCEFSYFCKYVLKLEDKKAARFDLANIGTFIHHVLEKFLLYAEGMGGVSKISDENLEEALDKIIKDYMYTVCRLENNLSGSRIAHLFKRLKRSTRILCKNLISEFSQSDFSPKLFEVPIGSPKEGEKSIEPWKIPLDGDGYAYIYGIADRVDIYEKDEKYYARVVDYKTGAKEFSLEDVKMGINIQLLLYLFSIWKNGSKKDSALNIPVKSEVVPAGILYFSAGVPTVTLDEEATAEEVEAKVSEGLKRKGLLLDDPEILEAMEKGLAGKYIPVKQKKDGELAKTNSLATLEDFRELALTLEKTIKGIAGQMKKGSAKAKPLQDKKHDKCAYCEMRPVCRKSHR